MERLATVGYKRERGRRDCRLGYEVDLQRLSRGGARRLVPKRSAQAPIELPRRDAAAAVLGDSGRGVQHLPHAPPRLRGEQQDRRMACEGNLRGQSLAEVVGRPDLALAGQVPLVRQEDETLAVLVGERGHARVLARRALARVDD